MLKKLLQILIRGYQILISPLLPRSCRYYPTCSAYMYQSIDKYGVVKGVWKGLSRIGRCHPWNSGDYVDMP
jgi:putative membrane protein insertion efficiency factor